MKRIFAIIDSIFHKESKHEAWKNIKYLVVLGHKKYSMPHALGEEYTYMTYEAETKKEIIDYLDHYVSKEDRKLCRIYKEIKTNS